MAPLRLAPRGCSEASQKVAASFRNASSGLRPPIRLPNEPNAVGAGQPWDHLVLGGYSGSGRSTPSEATRTSTATGTGTETPLRAACLRSSAFKAWYIEVSAARAYFVTS